jgi:hypothetical protein
MKFWTWLIRTVGVLSLIFALWGFYFQILVVQRVVHYPMQRPDLPFFQSAFFTMTSVDAILLAALAYTGLRLLRLQYKAVPTYTWLIVSIIVYEVAVGGLWLFPNPLGRSIASASGIGAVGIGPLLMYPVPFVYPTISVLVVNLARRKLRSD